MTFRRIASLKTADDFSVHLTSLGVDLSFDEEVEVGPAAPLAQPVGLGERTIGNRFAVLPMEGWDAAADGQPTELV